MLQKHESQNIEFKQKWDDDYLKWICAFANTDGGIIYIGVKDNGEVCGVQKFQQLSEDIPNKILHTMGLICDVKLLDEEGKKYFEIKVDKYHFPVSYHGRYYKRSGSTTQEVTGYELDKMILAAQGRTWDSIPVPHVVADDLDTEAIKIFKRMALDHNRLDRLSLDVPNDVLLRNLRLYENDYLTKAAVMCFHPDPEKWVTCAYIKIGFFADNDSDILYQDEVHGPLIVQVERAMDLIFTKYMKALISYEGIHRKETFFFPKDAFRELLLNAVIHRDYMRPTPIQIRIYAHKIRIWNIGKMPVEVPVEKLFQPHSSEPRNPNIANVFFKAGYVESWGRGYKNITDICDFRAAKLPVPEENSGGLVVECLASEAYLAIERAGGENTANQRSKVVKEQDVLETIKQQRKESQKRISDNVKKTFEAIRDNPWATRKELSEDLGITDRAVASHIAFLRREGYIMRTGGKTFGHWMVISTPKWDD